MGGPPKQTIPLSVLARNQRILGPEISPYPEVVRGRERELAGKRSWQGGGDWTAESWCGTTERCGRLRRQ